MSISNKIQHDLSNALQTIVRDLKIRAFLEENDPQALEQAFVALRAEYATINLASPQNTKPNGWRW